VRHTFYDMNKVIFNLAFRDAEQLRELIG